MALVQAEVDICNMALARIGSKRVTLAQVTADTDTRAQLCNLLYEQARDALLRSHWWRFAGARATLVAATAPAFQWTYAWTLPSDFLRMKYWWDDNDTRKEVSLYSYELEGNEMFTDETPVKIKYIKQVTAVADFDALFIEVLVLILAKKFATAIAQDPNLEAGIRDELFGTPGKPGLMSKVRALDKQEQNTVGRGEADTWNDALYGFGLRDPTKLGSN